MPVVRPLRGRPDPSVSALTQTERCERARRSVSAAGALVQPARLELPLLDAQVARELGSSSAILRLKLRQARRDVREAMQPRRVLGEIPLEPPDRRLLVLREPRLAQMWTGLPATSAVRREFTLAGNGGCSGVHVELPEDVLEVRSDRRA